MRFAIVAGGTGGHIYPGIAIAEEIRRMDPGAEILFLGSEEGLESDLFNRAGYTVKLIKARALLRKISYQALSAPFLTVIGFFQAIGILRSFRPQALISTGGYASLPAVLAARLLKLPIYVQEQNVSPGMTNRFCFKFARQIFLSFEKSRELVLGIVAGNPVRREIIEADRERARENMGFKPTDKVVVIMGGSQGARKINEAVTSALPLIKDPRIKIYHIVGKRDYALVTAQVAGDRFSFYKNSEYMYNIAEVLAAADLVVSRAGATAISEFLVRGIPMVLVPFPFSAEGHQDINARVIEEAGAGVIISNSDLTPQRLVSIISDERIDLEAMKNNCAKLARPGAAKEIVSAIL
jgi:UDP-N-acetylglucosamine--N-acetylmuramyl-(pentapeptide) pyrophosphoryl-undecaprenol N-acetylglucosamine transferase